MPVGADSVDLSGIPNRTPWEPRGTQFRAGLTPVGAIALPFGLVGRRKSCAKNEWLAEPGVGGCAIQAGCLRREDHFFPFPPTVESG